MSGHSIEHSWDYFRQVYGIGLRAIAAIPNDQLDSHPVPNMRTPKELAVHLVSNLGMLGIHEFTAIINPPEAGILAVGAMEDTPVVVDGKVEVRPRMRITMSCDHRVIDGATGARFLQTLKGMLENPLAMVY